MVEKGLVPSLRDAFSGRFIGIDGQCYYPTTTIPAFDAIAAIASAGGVPVLAHPALHRSQGITEEEIAEMKKTGLRGIEVFHACHSASDIERYNAIAGKFGLLKTGGTSCRGANYSPVRDYAVRLTEES